MIDGSDIFPTVPLWKFLSLADNQSPKWHERLDQLLDGRAYLPSPNQFNDPFDCAPTIGLPHSIEEFHEKLPRLVARFKKSMPNIDERVIADTLRQAVQLNGLDALRALTQESFNDSGAKIGVFCLAECIESVLMWSHYASNHTGIALRFDFRTHWRGGIMPLFKVLYQEDRPRLMKFFENSEVEGPHAEAIVDALRAKATFWQYEQEWRFIEANGAGTTKIFNPEIITGIVLGAKCTGENERFVMEVAKSRGIPLMRVVPDRETFKLNFLGLSDS